MFKKFNPPRDCLHDEACRSLLRHMGYTVDGDGDDADKRCDEFKYRTDYTEVVRCKDCKGWCSEEIAKQYGVDRYCTMTMMPTNADDFCSYGERRSDENND